MFKSVHKCNAILHASYRGVLKTDHISSAEMEQNNKKQVEVPSLLRCYKASAVLWVSALAPLSFKQENLKMTN
jgi:hypothetical protein